MSSYQVGVGRASVTDPAVGLGMQGMSMARQKTQGVEAPLYARAFIIEDTVSQQRVVLVSADIWSCTMAVKASVIERIADLEGGCYTESNVLISGTHNHSGPGGYSHYFLYNYSIGGFDPHNFECIVSGITRAILDAHENMAPGKIYINEGVVLDCGRQRSPEAYLNNPLDEREQYLSDTDKDMLLLKFVHVDDKGDEQPIALLNWYPIHPTDRGQMSDQVCGDNKGYASSLFEEPGDKAPFVAAFANSHCGDVSGNVEFGSIPDGETDREHMILHGKRQYDCAKQLFDSASEVVDGPIAVSHMYVDMMKESGLPAALGLSMFAGSTEDSDPGSYLREGIVAGSSSGQQTTVIEKITKTLIGLGFPILSGVNCPTANALTDDQKTGHLPKEVTLAPGLAKPTPLVPNILPLQLIQIGSLLIAGVPAELTTMAGRRLRNQLRTLFDDNTLPVALACYANGYSQYVTTHEEYQMQHYEGASTLFGPNTLMEYQQAFAKLAQALRDGKSSPKGETPLNLSSSVQVLRRVTIRNRSKSDVQISIYKQKDILASSIIGVALPKGNKRTVRANGELAWVMPDDVDAVKIFIDCDSIADYSEQRVDNVEPLHLVEIKPDGSTPRFYVQTCGPGA